MFNIVSLKPNPKVIFQTLERSLQSHRTDYTTVFTQWTSCVRSVEYPFNSRKKDSGHEMKPPRWTPDELFTKTCHFCVWVQEAKIYSSSSEGSAKTQIIILISSEWTCGVQACVLATVRVDCWHSATNLVYGTKGWWVLAQGLYLCC